MSKNQVACLAILAAMHHRGNLRARMEFFARLIFRLVANETLREALNRHLHSSR